jgi:RNA polymerase sigma-70 factor (ECF subfamily)
MPPPSNIPPEPEDTRLRDSEWMRRIQNGDTEAFRAVILAYQNRVAAALARMAGPAFDPEELAHEVFVRVWKSAHRYEPSAKLATWLLTIARNLFLNELRYRTRHPTVSMDAAAEGGHSPLENPAGPASLHPDAALIEQELRRAIDGALQKLPENQRTAMVLRRYEDLSYEEIAAVLGVSVGSVKSLLFRARATLKELLADYLP